MWHLDLRGNEGHCYRIESVVVAQWTGIQFAQILELTGYGRCLLLDDVPQSSELDEHIYHEALVHPGLVLHPHPRRIFIAGGAEGAVVREVLRHNTVETVTMVDIDEQLVKLCEQHLKHWHQGAFESQRLELVFEDARAYLERTKDIFDCIIADITDPLPGAASCRLFTRQFYELAYRKLGKDGIFVTQAETTSLAQLEPHLAIIHTLASVFPHVASYQTYVPFYTLPWGFGIASKTVNPRVLDPSWVDNRLQERACAGLRFYDGETHLSLFSSPKPIRIGLRKTKRTITDESPLVVI